MRMAVKLTSCEAAEVRFMPATSPWIEFKLGVCPLNLF